MGKNRFYEPQPVEQRCVVIKVPYNFIEKGEEKIDTLVITAIIRNNDSITLLNKTGSNIFDFRMTKKEFMNAFIIALTELSKHEKLVDTTPDKE